MWCSKCKTEYRDGFAVCSDCGAPLTAQNPKMSTASNPRVTLKHPCLLATGADVPDIEALLTLLRQSNIPAYIKDDLTMYNLSVNYMGYGLLQGICVDESRLSEAQRLLANSIEGWEPDSSSFDDDTTDLVYEETDNIEADTDVEDSDEKNYLEGYVHREKKLTTLFMCLTIGVPIAALLFLLLYLSE